MDSYAHYIVLLLGMVSVAWLFWLISQSPQPVPAHISPSNHCTRCGHSLSPSADRCIECGMELDTDDQVAAPLETSLLEQDWPSTRVPPRTPAPAEESITVHTTKSMREATRLLEQLSARGYACRMDTVEPPPMSLGPNSPLFTPPSTLHIKVYADDLAAARHYVRGLRRAARLKYASLL